MEDRKCEIVKLQECEKALYANFQASLGEDNEFAHFLTKVLKKKIKCMEKKEVRKEAGWGDTVLFVLWICYAYFHVVN